MVRPLKILAPLGDDPKALGLLVLPLEAFQPLEVTLFHVGKGGKLREAERIFRGLGISAEAREAKGDPAVEIAAYARTGQFDLLAMISHGRRGLQRAFLGSVAEQVLRHTKIPVLLAHPKSASGPWRLVAAAVDGSPESERVLGLAGDFAKHVGTPLHLVRVTAPGETKEARAELDLLCRRLEKKDITALASLRKGLPAPQLVRYAKELGISLLCLTTHGRDGLKRWVLGSVAEEVARRATCPVLIAHP